MRARIRTIKPEFHTSADLYDAEAASGVPVRVAFTGLWCYADREGRFEWKPRELKVSILPYDPVDFTAVLDALGAHGFIVRYAVRGREYGWIPGFPRHQVINNREEASRLPAPPAELVKAVEDGTYRYEPRAWVTREARVGDASTTPLVQEQGEGKGSEGNGTEGKDTAAIPTESGEAREQKHSGEVSRGELLGRIRKACAPRGGKVSEADMRSNADIADKLAKTYSFEELAQAVAGRRSRIELGEIPSMPPGCGWTLRVYWDKDTIRNQIDQDLGAYHAMPPPTPPTDEKRGGTSGIADVLDFTKFARGA